MLAIVVLVAGCIDDTSRLYIRRKKLLSVFDEVAFRNSRPLHRYPWSHSLLVHFSPLPLLLFSFLFVRWYWISFFRKFDFAKELIQTNEIYMINKIEDSKFSKNFQSFVPHYSILFFPPSSQRFNLRNNVQTNFSTTHQPSLLDDLGLSSLLRTYVSVLTFRWTSDYHERSKKDRLCSGPEPGKPKISQGLPKILTRHDRRAKS